MKNFLLFILIFSAYFCNAQTGYPTLRNNGTIGAQEEYLINSPGNTPGNSVVTKRTKDSTYFELLLKNLYLRNLPNTVNNGNPVNFLHTDADGRVLSSSLSWLFPDTLNTFVTKSYLALNVYTKAQSDMKYLQSYAPDSQSVVNAVGVSTWQSLLSKLSVETDPLFNSKFAGKSTTDLVEGVNLYYTPLRFMNAFNAALTSSAINTALSYTAYNGAANPLGFITNSTLAAYLQKSDSNLYVPKYRLDSAVNSFYATAALKLNISSFTTAAINALYGGVLALKSDTASLNLSARLSAKLNTPTGSTSQYLDGTGQPKNFSTAKRYESYSGVTNASGDYTFTFNSAFSAAPNVQASLPNQANDNLFFRVSSVSTTGCTIRVFSRASITTLPIIGALTGALLSAVTVAAPTINVDVMVFEK